MRILILAASAAALLAGPALAAKTAPPAAASTTNTVATAKPATPSSTSAAKPKGESKMAKCAAEWKAMGDKGHVAYNDKAKSMKSKKGNKLSGYNAWTGECMKRA